MIYVKNSNYVESNYNIKNSLMSYQLDDNSKKEQRN